jgi:uncharacterized caspase-like protein
LNIKAKENVFLAASQAAQEAYALKEGNHSIFTYYLLQGLRGNEKQLMQTVTLHHTHWVTTFTGLF